MDRGRFCESHKVSASIAIEGLEARRPRAAIAKAWTSEGANQDSGLDPIEPRGHFALQGQGPRLAIADRRCLAQDRQEGELIEPWWLKPAATAPSRPARRTQTADAARTGAISVR